MKKITVYFLMSVLCCLSTAFAAEPITGVWAGRIDADGQDLGKNVVSIHPGSTEEKVIFVLPNFNFLGVLQVGDIVLADVPVTDSVLSMADYPLYLPALKDLGQALVTIDINEGSCFRGDSLIALLAIDIPGLGTIPVSFRGEKRNVGYQVPNGDFEVWEQDTSDVKEGLKGMEPAHWNSFVTASTNPAPDMAGLEGFLKMALNNTQLTDSTIARPGGEGTKSALITSKVTFGIKANGNLTTGRINAGSMDVKSPYNSNISDPTADDRFKCPFYGTPDSLAVWVKYRPANGDIDTAVNVAGIKAIIHNNGVYQDPEDSIMRIDSSFVENVELAKTDTILDTTMIAKYDTVKVAQAITNYKAVEGYEWQRISVPFEYFDDDVYTHKDSAQWIIVSFSTNVTPGGGTAKGKVVDSIFVDDLSLIYNQAHLTQLSVGEEVVNLVDGTYEYTVKQPFNDTTLVITAAAEGAEGASVVTAFDRLTERALVIVKGGDYSVNPASAQCYTINFTKPTPAGVDNAGTGAVVYTEGMMLHIESETAEMAMIYATNGKLVATTTAKTYMLPYAGVWFVRIGNETYKVLAL